MSPSNDMFFFLLEYTGSKCHEFANKEGEDPIKLKALALYSSDFHDHVAKAAS